MGLFSHDAGAAAATVAIEARRGKVACRQIMLPALTRSFTSVRVTLGGQPANARLDAGQTVTLDRTATVTPDASLTIRLS